MARKKIELSQLERVCLYYEIFSGRRDWKSAYRLAKNKPEEKIDAYSQYYKWIESAAFKNTVYALDSEKKRVDEELLERVKKEFQKGIELGLENGDTDSLTTDFRNREQFLNWLNQQVNLVGDEKLRVDYLKMLSDLMRFKEADNKDKEQDIQRFYTPLQCSECKLYQLQKEKTNV